MHQLQKDIENATGYVKDRAEKVCAFCNLILNSSKKVQKLRFDLLYIT